MRTTVRKTLDPAMCAEVSRELTLRLLSGDGESLDAVDTSSEVYQTQYQTVYDALSRRTPISGAGHQGEQRGEAFH